VLRESSRPASPGRLGEPFAKGGGQLLQAGAVVRQGQEAHLEGGGRERHAAAEQGVEEGPVAVRSFGRDPVSRPRRLALLQRKPEDGARPHERRGHGGAGEHRLEKVVQERAQPLQARPAAIASGFPESVPAW